MNQAYSFKKRLYETVKKTSAMEFNDLWKQEEQLYIVGFEGQSSFSLKFGWLLGDPITHVGILFPPSLFANMREEFFPPILPGLSDEYDLYLFEATKAQGGAARDVFTGKNLKHAGICSFTKRIKEYKGDVFLRQTGWCPGIAGEACFHFYGRPYEKRLLELFAAWFDLLNFLHFGSSVRWLFCSELVARFLKRTCYLDHPSEDPSEVLPGDFFKNPLGEQKEVLRFACTKPMKRTQYLIKPGY